MKYSDFSPIGEFDIEFIGYYHRRSGASSQKQNDDQYLDNYWYQLYNVIQSLKHQPNPRTVLDIGANVGHLALRWAKTADQVIAFEAHPTTYKKLERNIQVNNITNIQPHNLAVSDTAGEVVYMTDRKNSGSNSVSDKETPHQATTTTINDYISHPIDIIKIDVEGFEDRVLTGGKETILYWKPVLVIEINPKNEHLHNIIKEWGYKQVMKRCKMNYIYIPESELFTLEKFC